MSDMTSSLRNGVQSWYKFSNVLIYWSIRMIHAKNYEIVSTFVKVMQEKNCGFAFFRTRCRYTCKKTAGRQNVRKSPYYGSVLDSKFHQSILMYRDHFFRRTQNLEPSRGICPFLRNFYVFMEFGTGRWYRGQIWHILFKFRWPMISPYDCHSGSEGSCTENIEPSWNIAS